MPASGILGSNASGFPTKWMHSGIYKIKNRLCFGLAAYNGGYGHLIDARDLAGKLGRNPDLWVENVDHAYTLLSTPEYADKAKYGYCRSEEITGYVRKIIARYISYKSDIERLAQTAE